MYENIKLLEEKIREESEKITALQDEIAKHIVGQKEMVQGLIKAMLTGGHVLLEGVPGLAKTLAVNTLAQTIDCKFKRIQFTPDMLPADLTGTNIFHPQKQIFIPKKGPIFSEIILADEINRAPAKVQSALLEVMQEKQITLGDETYHLGDFFLVLATQNPIEQEGTYTLPEAQIDRFMMKIVLDYPSKEEEREILEKFHSPDLISKVSPTLTKDNISLIKKLVHDIYCDDKVKDYIVDIIRATRFPSLYKLNALTPLIETGASPRATLALARVSKAHAFIQGRGYITPNDIKHSAFQVLRHRIKVSYEAEAENKTSDNIISIILDNLPVP